MISTDAPTPCQDNPDPFDAVLDHPCKETVEAAKAICAPCDHKDGCLIHALSTGATGVFGGRLLTKPVNTWVCARGHDLTKPGSTRPRITGGVICRQCDRDRHKRKQAGR